MKHHKLKILIWVIFSYYIGTLKIKKIKNFNMQTDLVLFFYNLLIIIDLYYM